MDKKLEELLDKISDYAAELDDMGYSTFAREIYEILNETSDYAARLDSMKKEKLNVN